MRVPLLWLREYCSPDLGTAAVAVTVNPGATAAGRGAGAPNSP